MDRTVDRHTALRLVTENWFEWRTDVGISGGFTGQAGTRLDPPMLIALYELRDQNLLLVNGLVVAATRRGLERLRQWDTAQLARWS